MVLICCFFCLLFLLAHTPKMSPRTPKTMDTGPKNLRHSTQKPRAQHPKTSDTAPKTTDTGPQNHRCRDGTAETQELWPQDGQSSVTPIIPVTLIIGNHSKVAQATWIQKRFFGPLGFSKPIFGPLGLTERFCSPRDSQNRSRAIREGHTQRSYGEKKTKTKNT